MPKRDERRTDATQLAACRGPKPATFGRRAFHSNPRVTASDERPVRRSEPRSPLDWVMLESRAEARNLHVTAAHWDRPPKRSKPHAAYRRDQPTTEAAFQCVPPRRGDLERVPGVSTEANHLTSAAERPDCRSRRSSRPHLAGRSRRGATSPPPGAEAPKLAKAGKADDEALDRPEGRASSRRRAAEAPLPQRNPRDSPK